MAAFDPETLDRWRALAIVDRDGSTVGTISEFYLDRETGYPTWALVTTGFFGSTRTFVPLVHATEISDGLQVPYEKSHIKDAPSVDLHDELSPDEEAVLFAHYGVEYQPSTEAAKDVAPEGLGPVPADTEPGSGEGQDAVASEPGSAEASETDADAVPDEPGTDEAAGGEGAGAGAADSAAPEGEGEAVPEEPGTTDPDATVDPELPSSEEWERVTDHPGPADAHQARAEHDARGPVAEDPGPADSGDDRFRTLPGDPDLSRTAPVEPGLPGSTAASRHGFPATIDKGAEASGSPAEEPFEPPGEPGWAPGAAGSFEEPEPADRPSGSSDGWREDRLAAERDRIARATAAQPEERSPLERARRRLERLVGGGQEPADHEPISPADREAAERARRARLGLDEDDNRRR
jgi:PRC-barrel domain